MPRPAPSTRPSFRALACAALVAALPLPVHAQSWTSSGTSAGFAVDGAFRAIVFACTGNGAVDLALDSPGGPLEAGGRYTVVVSVDGTAFILDTAARRDGSSGAQTLVHSAPLPELAPLLAALKAGSGVEISTPAGRYEVPLRGSGAALAALEAGCGA